MNPLNPLNWLKSAQDWFKTTELSSGFRPYLIYLLIICGMVLCLLCGFSAFIVIVYAAVGTFVLASVGFIVLFAIKAFQDPYFCRSEKHVERVMKIDMERMGNETQQIEATVVEQTPEIELQPDPKPSALPAPRKERE